MPVGTLIDGAFTAVAGDHLGSSSVVRDHHSKTRFQRYTPYGAIRDDSHRRNSLQVDETFTGQTHDPGTGLIDYNARHYDPQLGRFTRADTIISNPSNSQDLNRYSYVRNNPLKYSDPTGHCAEASAIGSFTATGLCVAESIGSRQEWLVLNSLAVKGTSDGAPVGKAHYASEEVALYARFVYMDYWMKYSAPPQVEGPWNDLQPVLSIHYDYTDIDRFRWLGSGHVQPLIASETSYAMAYGFAYSALQIGLAALLPRGPGSRVALPGGEISIGRNWRMAPFGNRTGHPQGKYPHYHRRGVDPSTGVTRPGQGIGRHRPWEQKSTDTRFWDRF